MNFINLVLAFLLAYLLGSFVTALWIGKIFHGTDIRDHGSGNAGATNAIRVFGWKTGIPVLLIDIAKGWLAAMLPVFFKLAGTDDPLLINLQILTGITAIIGHIFPVYAGFRGGKGVASVFGVLLALHPLLTASCAGIFLVMLFASGYVSISSMTAGVSFPVLLLTVFNTPSLFFKIFSVFVAIALIITHRKNIKRLMKGEESRFIKRKNKDREPAAGKTIK
jgi:glycerol-3-phosphate acyltransferase PlsY